METILVANEKGGAGKSATCLTLGTCLKAMGYKVLIIDTDPSGNLSAAALPENPNLVLYDVMENPGKVSLRSVICETDFCDILPTIKDDDTGGDLNSEELTLDDLAPRKNLRESFKKLENQLPKRQTQQILSLLIRANRLDEIYDFILIDTPPSADFIVTCGIVAADTLLVPCEPTGPSANGINMILASVRETKAKYNADIQIDGMVFTRYSNDSATRRNQTEMILGAAEEYFNIPIYQTKFHVSPPIEQSMNDNRPILEFPNGRGLDDSMSFTLEFLAKRDLEPRTNYPGLLRDENGNWIFRKNGSVYYTYTMDGDSAVVAENRFRLEKYDDAFKAAIGSKVFFSRDNLLAYLRAEGIAVRNNTNN